MPTIQEAIQAAAPGDIVKIPAGVYDVSNLVLPSDITLQADGNATIVGNLIVNGSNTVVQGFIFDGGFVDLWSSQGATVRDCVFNGGQASVKFTDADGALITNNNFNNVAGNVLDGWGLNQSTISGNHFTNCWQCINLDFNNDPTRGNNVVIDHNTFINTARMPIEVGPGETARTSNLVISNNWSDNSHVTNQASDGAVAYSIISTYGDHTLIEGNYAKGPSGPGIGIELAGSGEIANNSIDTFEFGIIVYGSGFNVHDNATVNTPIESVLNYSGGEGIIQNNTTDAASFHTPLPPDTSGVSSGPTTPADTTAPAVTSVAASGPGISGGAGDLNAGKTVTLTVSFGEAVTVAGGTPTLKLNDGGTATYTGGSGNSSLTFTHTVQAGQNAADLVVSSVSLNGATIKDAAGNAADLSAASNYNPAGTLHIDTKAPVVTEQLAGGGTTAVSPALTGTGDPGAVVNFTVDGHAGAGTTTANATGAWAYTPTGLVAGAHTVVASQTDTAGNTGSASLTFTLGSTPASPTGPAPVLAAGLASDTGASGSDKITTNPTLTGTADPNAVVHFTVDNRAIAATATANSTGAWSFTPTGLADGSHTIVASETNAAGVTGTRSFTFTLDTHAPIPTFTGGTLSGGQVTLKGSTGEANDSISIYDGNSWLGFATTGSDGSFSFTGAADSSVTHSYGMNATDLAGNEGHGASTLVLSSNSTATSPPGSTASPPLLTEKLAHDTGSSASDNITFDPTISGTADPNAVIHFAIDGKVVVATATANTTGSWSFTPTGLADGSHTIVASETNAAGATGTASLSFTLSSDAPIPQFTGIAAANGQVTLTGTTGEANDTVSLYDGNTWLGFTTTGGDGSFSFTGRPSSSAVHSYGVNATDLAGHEGHGTGTVILGTSAANTLTGGTGNDIIAGNGGNDRIIGGAGADKLSGGAGKDTFVYKAASDSNASGSDVVSDFRHGVDKFDFTNIAGINATKGVPTFQGNITGEGNLTLNAHSVAYLEVGGNTMVLVNTSNAAETVATSDTHAADMNISLLGVHLGLTGSDFHHV